MKTPYSEQIDTICPLSEYPRPQMVRGSYQSLNGIWKCAFWNRRTRPRNYDRKILVPFSPESELSGIQRILQPREALWYERGFLPLPMKKGMRQLLHFEAVDQEAKIWINGRKAGSHVGGFTSFTIDITDYLQPGNNILTVRVTDVTDALWYSRGKQKKQRGGIWYTPQSGIWQSVWLEAVPENYIESIHLRPQFRQGELCVTVTSKREEAVQIHTVIEGIDVTAEGVSGREIRLALPEGWKAWSPEDPVLYDLGITMGEDRIQSYFGMREFAMEKDDKGVPRLFLNGKPCFRSGVLDQGYYSDGLLTPPTDSAMLDDITLMKQMGFNVLRKHIKVEPLRWYYHCDRLGMLVWQDMINGGRTYNLPLITAPVVLQNLHVADDKEHYALFGRQDEKGREQYYTELEEMMTQLQNVVSLELWTPFNEGWGQFDSARALEWIREKDPDRLIDHASGWYDQQVGETRSLHVYFRPYRFRRDTLGRAVLLTEFGGYSLRLEGHCMSPKTFGYKGYKDKEALQAGFEKLYRKQILPAVRKGLAAAIYTQLSDVEDEVNGFITYDRKEVKYDTEAIKEINRELQEAILS